MEDKKTPQKGDIYIILICQINPQTGRDQFWKIKAKYIRQKTAYSKYYFLKGMGDSDTEMYIRREDEVFNLNDPKVKKAPYYE